MKSFSSSTDEFFLGDRPPAKQRRGRPPVHELKRQDFVNNSNSSSDAETLTNKRRTVHIDPSTGKEDPRPRRNTIGLPIRYQWDYDMNLDQDVQRVTRKIYMVGQDVEMGQNCKQTDKIQIQKFVSLHQSALPDLPIRSKVGRQKRKSPSKEPNVAKSSDASGLEDKKQPKQAIKTPVELEKFNIYHIKPRPLHIDRRTILQKIQKPSLKEKVKLNADKYPLNETSESPKEAIQQLKNLQQTDDKSPTEGSNRKLKSDDQISGDPHKMASKEALDWFDCLNLQNKTIEQEEMEETQNSLALSANSKLLKAKAQMLADSKKTRLKASQEASDRLILQNQTIEQETLEETQSTLAKLLNTKKLLADFQPCQLALKEASDWMSLKAKTIKQEKMEETVETQCTSTASSEWLKAKKNSWLQAKNLASKETYEWLKAGNQMLKATGKEGGIFGKQRKRKSPIGSEKDAPLNIVKVEVDEANGQLTQVAGENVELVKQWHVGIKRRPPGRPRKNNQKQNKPDEFKRRLKLVCTEQVERPRRTMVGPPIRYLLESEDLLEKSYHQLCPDEQKVVEKRRRGRPRKIQIGNTEVGGASEMPDTVEEEEDDSKWLIKEEETEMSLENGALNDNSLDLNSERANQDEELKLKIGNVGGVCKMLVLGPDRKWTKQTAPKLKSQGKIKERLYGRNESGNRSPDSDLQPELFLVKMKARNDSDDSDGDCEITYEFEDIEQFNYVVSPEEEVKTERDVGGACEMIALFEHVGDQNGQREWANRNAADKTQLEMVHRKALKAESEAVGGASHLNAQWESAEQELTVLRKLKRRWWKTPQSEAGDGGESEKGAKDVFLMHQDLDTGKTTIIPPCVVRLRQHT